MTEPNEIATLPPLEENSPASRAARARASRAARGARVAAVVLYLAAAESPSLTGSTGGRPRTGTYPASARLVDWVDPTRASVPHAGRPLRPR